MGILKDCAQSAGVRKVSSFSGTRGDVAELRKRNIVHDLPLSLSSMSSRLNLRMNLVDHRSDQKHPLATEKRYFLTPF